MPSSHEVEEAQEGKELASELLLSPFRVALFFSVQPLPFFFCFD